MVGDQAAYPDALSEALDRVRQAASLLDPDASPEEALAAEHPAPIDALADDGAGVEVEWSGAAVHAAAASLELSRATEEWSVPRLEVPRATVRRLPVIHGLAEGAYHLVAIAPRGWSALERWSAFTAAAARWRLAVLLTGARHGLYRAVTAPAVLLRRRPRPSAAPVSPTAAAEGRAPSPAAVVPELRAASPAAIVPQRQATAQAAGVPGEQTASLAAAVPKGEAVVQGASGLEVNTASPAAAVPETGTAVQDAGVPGEQTADHAAAVLADQTAVQVGAIPAGQAPVQGASVSGEAVMQGAAIPGEQTAVQPAAVLGDQAVAQRADARETENAAQAAAVPDMPSALQAAEISGDQSRVPAGSVQVAALSQTPSAQASVRGQPSRGILTPVLMAISRLDPAALIAGGLAASGIIVAAALALRG